MKVSRRDFVKSGSIAALGIPLIGYGFSEENTTKNDITIRNKVFSQENNTSVLVDDIRYLNNANIQVFKNISISPSVVHAGQHAEFKIKLEIGANYPNQPTRIAISLPTQLGFSKPSLFIDEDYGYLEVYSNNPELRWEKKIWDVQNNYFVTKKTDNPRKTGQHLVLIDLSEGLKEGDYVQLNWGDLGRGFGKGTQSTVLSLKEEYNQYVWIRLYENQKDGTPDRETDFRGYNRPVAQVETKVPIRIIPKPLNNLRLVHKSNEVLLLPLDIYGNIADVDDLSKEVAISDSKFSKINNVFHFKNLDVKIESKNKPLSKSGRMDNVFEGKSIFWGDMHNHSKYSNDVIEEARTEMSPYDMQIFAKERAGLDFYATSEHHQPWDIPLNQIKQSTWEETIEAVIKNDKPGEFLVFPGFEFRCSRGDTVLFFNYLPEFKEIDRPEWTDIRKVWEGLKGKDYISHPHFHNPGRLAENEWWQCPYPGVEPIAEIFSCHRSFERYDVFEQGRSLIKHKRKDRYGEFFLKNNIKYGFVANSDSHYGHPGMQGLSAVYAESLDKESILTGYRSRHTYGTSGDRIRMLFVANGKLMGSEIANALKKEFLIDVVGEHPLKKVELFKNGDLYKRFIPNGLTFKTEFVINDPDLSNWYVRATQINNQMAWSSAVWYE